jgi:hypothetical protein
MLGKVAFVIALCARAHAECETHDVRFTPSARISVGIAGPTPNLGGLGVSVDYEHAWCEYAAEPRFRVGASGTLGAIQITQDNLTETASENALGPEVELDWSIPGTALLLGGRTAALKELALRNEGTRGELGARLRWGALVAGVDMTHRFGTGTALDTTMATFSIGAEGSISSPKRAAITVGVGLLVALAVGLAAGLSAN